MSVYQVALPFMNIITQSDESYRDKLIRLLSEDLNFEGQNSKYASHDIHSFPAKFPPQLPNKFIRELTTTGDIVLEPMLGSGTSVLEAFLSGRKSFGFDIDPLALLISQVKVSTFDLKQVSHIGSLILKQAASALGERWDELLEMREKRWDEKTRDFIDYWFAFETQMELLALISEIEKLADNPTKTFFELVFSAIIITKSGGVSFALDLAHTRPHRAKVVISKGGKVLLGKEFENDNSRKIKILTKKLRSPLEDFEKRLQQNLKSLNFQNLMPSDMSLLPVVLNRGDAQHLPLESNKVDLIVTSPPYASNAIDYMRAHKFSLVWLGYSIDDLNRKRREYIGGEALDVEFEPLPTNAAKIVEEITSLNKKKGLVLHRYYSEMTRVLREMFRVLRPGKAAIVVVGSSILNGRDTETQNCLAEIGESIGFEVPKIGIRNLDRNRRMLPAGFEVNRDSQIQQRMHEEYIIGFCKPE